VAKVFVSPRLYRELRQLGNAPGGFVLAGRNMREVESREHLVGQLAMLAWLAMLGLIVVATAAFGWFTRRGAFRPSQSR